MERINVPDHLDEFDHYLIWQIDEIIFVVIGLMFGIIFRQPFIGFLFGYFIRTVYVRVRDGKPHGYIFHRLRELGFIPSNKNKGGAHPPALVDEYFQ